MTNPLQFLPSVRMPSLSSAVDVACIPTLPKLSKIAPGSIDRFTEGLQRLPLPTQGKLAPLQIQDNPFTQAFNDAKEAKFITEAQEKLNDLVENYSTMELVIGGAGVTTIAFVGAYALYKTGQLGYRATAAAGSYALGALRYLTSFTRTVAPEPDNDVSLHSITRDNRGKQRIQLTDMRPEPALGQMNKAPTPDSQEHVATQIQPAPVPAVAAVPAASPNPQDFPTIQGFTVTEFIAGGGMGAVYRARENSTGLNVAIKVMKPDLSDARFIDRFIKETRNLLNVHSRYVVRYRASGKTKKGEPWLVLDYIPGGTLSQIVRKRGIFSDLEAIDIVLKVAEGFAAMGEKGIVHRDIKPANIMLTPKKRNISGDKLPPINLATVDWDSINWGQFNVNDADWSKMPWQDLNIEDFEPMIVDFGLSRASDVTNTHSNEAMGTPYYMPIEQYDPHAQPDSRTDLCALGYTLFYMLTATSPFGDLNQKHHELASYLETRDADKLAFMQTYLRTTSLMHPEIKKFINKATHPDRELRFPNAQAFMRALIRVRDRISSI